MGRRAGFIAKLLAIFMIACAAHAEYPESDFIAAKQPVPKLATESVTVAVPNGHGNIAAPDNETRPARFPLSIPPPQAVEGAVESLREFHVKRKVALTQFDVANTQHVDDISNIYDGLPQVLAGRLEAGGELLSVYDGRAIPQDTGAAQREAVMLIAAKTGAQFVLHGMVANAGSGPGKGILGTSIGAGKKRYIELELSVYDGLTGTRLMLRRYTEQAAGDVKVGNNKPFGSSIFFESEFGQALNRLLDLSVKEIVGALKSIPFSARIVKVQEKTVFLDAGSDSRLKPGDKLVAYVRDGNAAVLSLNGTVLGAPDRPADTLTLTQVQPQFSIGELSEAAAINGIKAGNIARINLLEQQEQIAKRAAAQQMAKALQEAAEEAERVKNAQAALEEAEKAKAEQAELERVNAEKTAKAQVAAEAKHAKLNAQLEVKARRISAAQESRNRQHALAVSRADAKARAAELKVAREAESARLKAEEKTRMQLAAEERAMELKVRREIQAEASRIKAEEETIASRVKAEQQARALESAKAAAQAAADLRAEELKVKLDMLARLKAEDKAGAQIAAELKAEEQKARRAAKGRATRSKEVQEAKAEAAESATPEEDPLVLDLEDEEEDKWLEVEAKAAEEIRVVEQGIRREAKAARLKAAELERLKQQNEEALPGSPRLEVLPSREVQTDSLPLSTSDGYDKARLEADARIAKLKAKAETKAEKKSKAALKAQASAEARAAQRGALPSEAAQQDPPAQLPSELPPKTQHQPAKEEVQSPLQAENEEKARLEATVKAARNKVKTEQKAVRVKPAKKGKAEAGANAESGMMVRGVAIDESAEETRADRESAPGSAIANP